MTSRQNEHVSNIVVDGTELRYGKLSLVLDVEELSALYPHEETLTYGVDRLEAVMRKDGLQIDPVIVDTTAKVVLDGMHRMEALKRMGCDKAVVCRLDYWNQSIEVGRWLRCLKHISDDLLEELIRKLQLKRFDNTREMMREVNEYRSPIALLTKTVPYLSEKRFTDTHEAYDLVREFDRSICDYKFDFQMEPDMKTPEELDIAYSAVLFPSPIGKKEVLHCGMLGKLLPPKSSRHVIPCKPVGLNFPVQWLTNAFTIESSRRHLGVFFEKLACNRTVHLDEFNRRLFVSFDKA